jgi:hypothetical protein
MVEQAPIAGVDIRRDYALNRRRRGLPGHDRGLARRQTWTISADPDADSTVRAPTA